MPAPKTSNQQHIPWRFKTCCRVNKVPGAVEIWHPYGVSHGYHVHLCTFICTPIRLLRSASSCNCSFHLHRIGAGALCPTRAILHERQSPGNRHSRMVVEECMKWALCRKVFGKPLIQQAVIRFKMAEMIASVEVQTLCDAKCVWYDKKSSTEWVCLIHRAVHIL